MNEIEQGSIEETENESTEDLSWFGGAIDKELAVKIVQWKKEGLL